MKFLTNLNESSNKKALAAGQSAAKTSLKTEWAQELDPL
jgi:hypothetical protein